MNLDRRLTALIREQRAPFAGALLSGVLASAMVLGQAWSLSSVVSGAFIERLPVVELLDDLAFFALFSLLRTGLDLGARIGANRGSTRIRQALFARLAALLAQRGPLFAATRSSGRLTTTILKGVEALDAYFSSYLPQLLFALAGPLFILAAIFPFDAISAAIMLLTAPLIPLFMALIGKRAKHHTDLQWESLSRMGGRFLDMLQGLATLKLFSTARRQHDAIAEAGESFRKSTMKVLRIAFLSSLTLELVGTIGTAMVAVGIGLRLMAGEADFRISLFVLLLAPEFYLPLRQLGLKFHAGMEGSSASKEIHALIDAPASEPKEGELVADRAALARQPILFEGVTCRYGGKDEQALNAVTFRLEAGTTTALVGPSGAGKSTLASLLLRFQDPVAGALTFCGEPLTRYRIDAWLEQVAWVPQHPFLFNESLEENIMMARPAATSRELQQAVRDAGLEALVASLPEGLQTVLGEQGARLSGGEAQRVALARAFLKDAPLVVLDEPTSNTDPLLEAELNDTMHRLLTGRTALLIAHRMESVRRADRIIVLEEGRVTASGTHNELAGREGYYARTFAIQEGGAA